MSKKTEQLEAFERKSQPDQYFEKAKVEFRQFYNDSFPSLQAADKAFRNLIILLLEGKDFNKPKVTSRIKDRSECSRKFDKKYRVSLGESGEAYQIKDHITDLIGLRIVCLYESDLEKIKSVLGQQLEIISETDKSAEIEKVDNEFGYKGLHLDVRLTGERQSLPEYSSFAEQPFEVQIRTIVQDAWSEVDHKLKYKSETPGKLKRRIYRLAALFELADQEFENIKNDSEDLQKEANSPTFDEKKSVLDAFSFLRVAGPLFGSYNFEGETFDHLLGQIKDLYEDIKVQDFRKMLQSKKPIVDDYREYMKGIGNNMNPYTQIRHSLYAAKPSMFSSLIFDGRRRNFDRWCEHGTVFPAEVRL